ncbi:hypothetical protein PT974_10998 [Cladobotryum mycophilum]|uniref:Mitochondrial inner membrane protein 1 n=1 Tax=Cladobotryum mycophilum TaxID=491253 RepID=A0ABR0SC99_9HYPO
MFQASRTLLQPFQRTSRTILQSRTLTRARRTSQPSWLRPSPQAVSAHRHASSSRPPSKDLLESEHEREVANKKLESHPSQVSTTSSVRTIVEPSTKAAADQEDIGKGLQHDINIVKDTFRLDTVPRESHILGLTGTVPYFATSLSTVFLAWDLTKEWPTGNAFFDAILVNHDTAKYLLDVIEPLQLGYGAVIISFLGAIHWGLEYAEKQPQHDRTRFRYGIGLAASIVAWPTVLMPIEYALTTQFMAFVALYYADSRATTRGWAPQWYAKYRFLLTAMVGLAIFISLIGRAKIEQKGALSGKSLHSKLADPGIADRETNWAKLEEEERKKNREEKKKKEAEKSKESSKKKNDEVNKDDKKDDKKNEKRDDKNMKKDEDEDEDEQKAQNDGQDKGKDKKSDEDKKKGDATEDQNKDQNKNKDKTDRKDDGDKGDKGNNEKNDEN